MPLLRHTLIFDFLAWIEELPLDGAIGGREEPPKKSRIDDGAYNLKKLLGNASLTGIFCLYEIATYTSVSSSADVLFFPLLLNTLCRQAVSQRKWSIPLAYFVREILFFGSFWSSLLWLLFLDWRHSFVNLFPHFFVVTCFWFYFFPLFANRSIMHDAILQSRSARSWVCC